MLCGHGCHQMLVLMVHSDRMILTSRLAAFVRRAATRCCLCTGAARVKAALLLPSCIRPHVRCIAMAAAAMRSVNYLLCINRRCKRIPTSNISDAKVSSTGSSSSLLEALYQTLLQSRHLLTGEASCEATFLLRPPHCAVSVLAAHRRSMLPV